MKDRLGAVIRTSNVFLPFKYTVTLVRRLPQMKSDPRNARANDIKIKKKLWKARRMNLHLLVCMRANALRFELARNEFENCGSILRYVGHTGHMYLHR